MDLAGSDEVRRGHVRLFTGLWHRNKWPKQDMGMGFRNEKRAPVISEAKVLVPVSDACVTGAMWYGQSRLNV